MAAGEVLVAPGDPRSTGSGNPAFGGLLTVAGFGLVVAAYSQLSRLFTGPVGLFAAALALLVFGFAALGVGMWKLETALARRVKVNLLVDGDPTRARVRESWALWGAGLLVYVVGALAGLLSPATAAVLSPALVGLAMAFLLGGCFWYAFAAARGPAPSGALPSGP